MLDLVFLHSSTARSNQSSISSSYVNHEVDTSESGGIFTEIALSSAHWSVDSPRCCWQIPGWTCYPTNNISETQRQNQYQADVTRQNEQRQSKSQVLLSPDVPETREEWNATGGSPRKVISILWYLDNFKRFPFRPHTSWPNRAEMGVRLYKKFLSALVDPATKNLDETTLSQITPAQLMRKAATVGNTQVTLSGKTPMKSNKEKTLAEILLKEWNLFLPTFEWEKVCFSGKMTRAKFSKDGSLVNGCRWKSVLSKAPRRFTVAVRPFFQASVSKLRRPLDTEDLEELPDSRERTGAPVLWLSCKGQIDVRELVSENSYFCAIVDRQGHLVAAPVDLRT